MKKRKKLQKSMTNTLFYGVNSSIRHILIYVLKLSLALDFLYFSNSCFIFYYQKIFDDKSIDIIICFIY